MAEDSSRSGVTQETMYEVLNAFHHLDCRARTSQLADHHSVSVSKEQVKTAMRLLQEWGYIESIQDGIYQFWVPREEEWWDEELHIHLDNLTTEEELYEIRSNLFSESTKE